MKDHGYPDMRVEREDDVRVGPLPCRRHRWIYAALGLLVLGTRLPLVPGAGLGLDPDAWRLYVAGRAAADAGTYLPSRPPGYPFLEFLSVLLRAAPWWVFSTLTTAATTIAALAVAALARDLEIRAWPLVGAGLAFTNVIWQNSTAYMDYNWALAFLACAMLATHRRHVVAAGVLAGLAMVTRPTSVLAVTALAVVMLLTPWWTWRRFLVFTAAGSTVLIAFFVVPLLTYGLELMSAATTTPSLALGVDHLIRAGGGARAGLGIAVAVGIWGARLVLGRRGARYRSAPIRTWGIALAVSTAVQLAAFFAMPIDAGYVTPVVAMVWIGAGLVMGRLEMAVLTAAVLAGSLISGSVVPSIGQVTADRRAMMVEMAGTLTAIRQLPEGTVVVARGRQPQLLAMSGADPVPQVDPMGPGTRVVLDTGQVLARNYDPADDVSRTYRLAGVGGIPRFLPVLGTDGPHR